MKKGNQLADATVLLSKSILRTKMLSRVLLQIALFIFTVLTRTPGSFADVNRPCDDVDDYKKHSLVFVDEPDLQVLSQGQSEPDKLVTGLHKAFYNEVKELIIKKFDTKFPLSAWDDVFVLQCKGREFDDAVYANAEEVEKHAQKFNVLIEIGPSFDYVDRELKVHHTYVKYAIIEASQHSLELSEGINAQSFCEKSNADVGISEPKIKSFFEIYYGEIAAHRQAYQTMLQTLDEIEIFVTTALALKTLRLLNRETSGEIGDPESDQESVILASKATKEELEKTAIMRLVAAARDLKRIAATDSDERFSQHRINFSMLSDHLNDLACQRSRTIGLLADSTEAGPNGTDEFSTMLSSIGTLPVCKCVN